MPGREGKGQTLGVEPGQDCGWTQCPRHHQPRSCSTDCSNHGAQDALHIQSGKLVRDFVRSPLKGRAEKSQKTILYSEPFLHLGMKSQGGDCLGKLERAVVQRRSPSRGEPTLLAKATQLCKALAFCNTLPFGCTVMITSQSVTWFSTFFPPTPRADSGTASAMNYPLTIKWGISPIPLGPLRRVSHSATWA